jgi:hypothetical protein
MNKKAVIFVVCITSLTFAPKAFAYHMSGNMFNQNNVMMGMDSKYSNSTGYLTEVSLSPDNEIPRVNSEVSGNAGVWFGENGKDMNYWLSAWSDNENLTAAHIHCGDPGENGPAIVTLFHDQGIQASGEIGRGYLSDGNIESGGASCDDVIGYEIRNLSDLSRAIREGRAYVNLHSQNYPNGVARGQLGTQSSNPNNNWSNQNWNNQSNQSNWWWNNYNYSSSSPWQTGSSSSWSQSNANSYANSYAQGYAAGASAYANSSANTSVYSSSSSGNWSDQFWRSW